MDVAIYKAFMRGGSSCDQLLEALAMGGAVNFQRKLASNTTALMAAAHGSRPDIIRALLDAGARHNVCDEYGRTALDFAIHSGHGPTIEILDDCSNSSSEVEAVEEEVGSGSGSGSGKIHKMNHLETDDDQDEEMCYDYFVMKEGGEVAEGEGQLKRQAQAYVKSYHFSQFEEQQKEEEMDQERMYAWMEQQMDDEENMDENFEEYDENHENAVGNDYGDMTSEESEGGSNEDNEYGDEDWF